MLSKLLKTFLLPPLSLVVLALIGWGMRRRWPRVGRACLFVALGSLYLLSMPYTGSLLLRSLQTTPVLTPRRLVPQAGAIVVLSGDYYRYAPEYGGGNTVGSATLERLRYGVRLLRDLHLPLLVSGGTIPGMQTSLAAVMQETLTRDFQAPARWLESESLTTYENAKFSAKILREQGIDTVYLVTHSWHMPRARAAFKAFGIRAIPAPTVFAARPTPLPGDFLPTARGLTASYNALYEWIGRLWYALSSR